MVWYLINNKRFFVKVCAWLYFLRQDEDYKIFDCKFGISFQYTNWPLFQITLYLVFLTIEIGIQKSR